MTQTADKNELATISALENRAWWGDDKLDRKTSADFLTNYLTKRYTLARDRDKPDTFVLTVRAEWGFGKTFFLKRWADDLRHSGYPVVLYDAWANDFSDDPLIGFISEINAALSEKFKGADARLQLKKTFAIGRKLIKPIGLGVANIIAKKVLNHSVEELKDVFSQGAEAESHDNTEKEKNLTKKSPR